MPIEKSYKDFQTILKYENFAPAKKIGNKFEIVDMPKTNAEAQLINHVKHIGTGKVYEWNQDTRIADHNMDWELRGGKQWK
jgi:hypothetical protein